MPMAPLCADVRAYCAQVKIYCKRARLLSSHPRLFIHSFVLTDIASIFQSWSTLVWIEICEIVVLSKIDITMTTMNKKL